MGVSEFYLESAKRRPWRWRGAASVLHGADALTEAK
jgi:hypothetical protein